MKKIYIEAELEVIDLLNADIITASGDTAPGNGVYGDNDGDTSGWWN